MATLNIKNFPDKLYRRLQARARQQRRSLSQEAAHILAELPSLRIVQLEDHLKSETTRPG